MNLQQLSLFIKNLEGQLENDAFKSEYKFFYQSLLEEKITQYNRLLTLTWSEYGQLFRSPFLAVLKILDHEYRNSNNEFLIRRAFFAAHYGIIDSEILGLETFSNLARSRLHIGIWRPILTDLANFSKTQFKNIDLHAINELNCSSVIKTFPKQIYTDFSVIVGNGLPLLVVEMAEKQIPSGKQHKDIKKMMVTMAHILMELSKNASIHCADDDFSLFKVFGLLICGDVFELSVGCIVKEGGKLNFMFHHHEKYWNFALFGNHGEIIPQNLPGSENFLSIGSDMEFGIFQSSDLLSEDPFELAGLFPQPQDEGEDSNPEFSEFEDFRQNLTLNQFENSLKVLVKFLQLSMLYYNNLSSFLKECYQLDFPDVKSRLEFLPEGFVPPLAISASRHGNKSQQDLTISFNNEKIDITRFESKFYEKKFSKHYCLPDVISLIVDKQYAFIKVYKYDMDPLIQELLEKCKRLYMDALKYIPLTTPN